MQDDSYKIYNVIMEISDQVTSRSAHTIQTHGTLVSEHSLEFNDTTVKYGSYWRIVWKQKKNITADK